MFGERWDGARAPRLTIFCPAQDEHTDLRFLQEVGGAYLRKSYYRSFACQAFCTAAFLCNILCRSGFSFSAEGMERREQKKSRMCKKK